MATIDKRKQNEKKFQSWINLPTGGRRYMLTVKGALGWVAFYIKEVDAEENTIRFYQEIHDEKGKLKEVHEKFPTDKGHQIIQGDQ